MRDYMLRQAYEEYVWYQLLTGESELPNFSTFSENYRYRNDLFRFWKQICFLLRRHAANLTDRDCNAKIPEPDRDRVGGVPSLDEFRIRNTAWKFAADCKT